MGAHVYAYEATSVRNVLRERRITCQSTRTTKNVWPLCGLSLVAGYLHVERLLLQTGYFRYGHIAATS